MSSYNGGYGIGDNHPHLDQNGLMQFPPPNENLYQELVAWLDNDDMQQYNNFLL